MAEMGAESSSGTEWYFVWSWQSYPYRHGNSVRRARYAGHISGYRLPWLGNEWLWGASSKKIYIDRGTAWRYLSAEIEYGFRASVASCASPQNTSCARRQLRVWGGHGFVFIRQLKFGDRQAGSSSAASGVYRPDQQWSTVDDHGRREIAREASGADGVGLRLGEASER